MKISFSKVPLSLLVAFLFISPLTTKAQIPGLGIFFQAIARDKMDNPAKYRKIYIQTSIIESMHSTGSFLTEIHQSTTDANGIFNISIGQGKQTSGTSNDLLSIPWSKGPMFLNLKIAIEPLTPLMNWDYTKEWIDLGSSPFGTVPYALSAGNTTTITDINKVNVKDSNLVYVTPFQLLLKKIDTTSLSNRINNKLNVSDTSTMLSPYTKQNQVNSALALKLNIADTASMLKNYTVSSKLSALAFTGNYNDIFNKPTAIGNIVNTINNLTGDIIIDKNTIGFGYVDNTSDANKPVSILTNDALAKKVDKSSINIANGIPSLDVNTKIPSNLLPAISFTSVLVANSSTQMQGIGTTALKGTVVVRTDISKTYILSADNSTNLSDWIEILNPGAPVQSVNGKLANVSLTSSDIMEGSNEYFTQNKARLSISANTPINYNAASGLLTADTSTSNYGLVTRYNLQQVNNANATNLSRKVNISDTSSMLFPYAKTITFKKYIDSVSDVLNSNIVASNNGIVIPDATINTKGILKLAGDLAGSANAPIIADGVVTNNKIAAGISASKVGLGNVNNTDDLSKPISTLTQNALNLKLYSTDTATMLSNYLSNIHNTNNTLATKFNVSDSANMLSNYKNYQITLNNIKLNKSDTAAMLSAYLVALDKKELTANKSNDATLGGGSPSVTLYPTQSAIKQYVTNTIGSSSISATSLIGVVSIANGGTGQSTPNAAFNALAASQTSNNGKFLTTDGTNASWTSITTPWSILGNAGMVDGTNFIGTTDAQPLNFQIGGIVSGRFDVSAVSGQATLGYGAGSTTQRNTTSNYGVKNTGFGFNAIKNTTYGNGNTALGYQSLLNNFSGSGSTAIGYQAMSNANSLNTSSTFMTANTAMGYQSLQGSATATANTGIANTAIGFKALQLNTSGGSNNALGAYSLNSNTTGYGNSANGYYALNGNTSGNENTAIGIQSLLLNTTGFSNTAVGSYALNTNLTGYGNTATGSEALTGNTTGKYNTGFGRQTLSSNIAGDYNTAIGNAADVTGDANNSTAIGNGAITALSNAIQLGNANVTSVNTAGTYITTNTSSATSSSTGALVVAGGAGIGGNLYIGGNAFASTPSSNDNSTKLATTAYVMNAIAGVSTTTSGSSGWGLTGNSGMVDGTNFIGTTDAQPLNFVVSNTASGRIDASSISGQTSLGYGAASSTVRNVSNSDGTKNTGIGYQAIKNTGYGKENTALGYQAMLNNYSGSGSTAIGFQAMSNTLNNSQTSAVDVVNTAIGYKALQGSATPANNTGIKNTAVGGYSMLSNTSGSFNTASGYMSLRDNSSGNNNTASGITALVFNTSGNNNVGFGNFANGKNMIGNNNTAVGNFALGNNTATGNTAIGYFAGNASTTGTYNTFIGYGADAFATPTNSTAIGYGAIVVGDNTMQLGNTNLQFVSTSGMMQIANYTESTDIYNGALSVSGGAGIAKNLNVGGTVFAAEVDTKHLKGNSATPTIAASTGAGTTPTISISGTDMSGVISIRPGTSPSINAVLATITYNIGYSTAPVVVITPANAVTASLSSAQAVWINIGTTNFTINTNSTALSGSIYKWNYVVIQ